VAAAVAAGERLLRVPPGGPAHRDERAVHEGGALVAGELGQLRLDVSHGADLSAVRCGDAGGGENGNGSSIERSTASLDRPNMPPNAR
jgi:hypothetical protein